MLLRFKESMRAAYNRYAKGVGFGSHRLISFFIQDSRRRVMRWRDSCRVVVVRAWLHGNQRVSAIRAAIGSCSDKERYAGLR